jgi:hypothetical protein
MSSRGWTLVSHWSVQNMYEHAWLSRIPYKRIHNYQRPPSLDNRKLIPHVGQRASMDSFQSI